MRFILFPLACLARIGLGSVLKQARPGLAVPVHFEGSSVPNWFVLNLQSSSSALHSPASCPVLLNCDLRGKTELSLPGGIIVQDFEFATADLAFPDFSDVAGVIGLGPHSELVRNKVLQFRQQPEGVVLRISDSSNQVATGARFPSITDSDGWGFPGFLEAKSVGLLGRSLKDIKEMVIDFGSDDIVIPVSVSERFSKPNRWIVRNSRLFVDCAEMERSGGTLMELKLTHANGGKIKVPVKRIAGWTIRGRTPREWESKSRRESDKCATNLVFAGSNRVVIGRSVLAKYDVSFNAVSGYMDFRWRELFPDFIVIFNSPLPSNRFRLDQDPLKARYPWEPLTWTWTRTVEKTIHRADFIVKRLPRLEDSEPVIELLCIGDECSYRFMRWFAETEELKQWIGAPQVVVNEGGAVEVKEICDWLVRRLVLTIEGNLHRIRFQHVGYRSLWSKENSIDGERIEFHPYGGKKDKSEFLFTSWPPVLREGVKIDLLSLSERKSDGFMKRWRGIPTVYLEGHAVVIASSYIPENEELLERTLTLREDSLVFGSEPMVRYCIVLGSQDLKLVRDIHASAGCELPILLKPGANPQITGSTGRFLLLAFAVPGAGFFTRPFEHTAWIGDPILQFDNESEDIVIVPSSGGQRLRYDVILFVRKGTVRFEFIAKRPRFRLFHWDPHDSDKYVFTRVNDFQPTAGGELILNLQAEHEDEPVRFFEKRNGVLELRLAQVTPLHDGKVPNMLTEPRVLNWVGRPRISIDRDGDLIITGTGRELYRIEFEKVNDKDFLMRFIPKRF